MAQELERNYGFGDDPMLERAQVFHDRLTLELADFTARFPWLDATWLTAFQNDITAADAFPKDESVTLDIKILTGDVNSAMQQGYAALQTLGSYAKLAYPTDLARQRGFGQQNWSNASKTTLKLQEALELAFAKADDAALKPALIARGYTQTEIDQLNTLATELQTKNGLQEAAKAGRKVTSQDRIGLLNIVWDHMRTVNICADVVWANDAGRREQYQLYPTKGGSNNGDDNGGGNNPNTSARISGQVTSMSDGMPIGGAEVRVYTVVDGPGGPSIGTSTDPNGNYTIVIPEMPAAEEVVIEASAQGFLPQQRNLLIGPGQSFDGENFSLMTA